MAFCFCTLKRQIGQYHSYKKLPEEAGGPHCNAWNGIMEWYQTQTHGNHV
jgi:hypothetical protein